MFRNIRQTLADRMILRREGPVARQFGAIPYRILEGDIAFLLITSRRSGRWIFPKGGRKPSLAPQEIAAREAFEEAGVEGRIQAEAIGTYRTVKTSLRRYVIEVEHYALEVAVQHDDWPEKGQRYRHWALLPEAKRLVRDKAIIELLVRLRSSLVSTPS